MNFLFEGIFDILITICKGFMCFFAGDFWTKLMVPEPSSGVGGALNFHFAPGAGSFDAIFPGMITMRKAIHAIAWMLSALIFMFGMMRALMPDTPNSKASHPFLLTGRFALASITSGLAYPIMTLIQYPMWTACREIQKLAVSGGRNGVSTNPFVNSNLSFEEKVEVLLPDNIFSVEAFTETFLPANSASEGLSREFRIVPIAICCILMLVLAYAFLKLVMEAVERFVVCGFLYYMAPIGFSLLASEGTSNATKSYMQMMISQYLVITFNLLIIYVFFGSIQLVNNTVTGTGTILTICMLIAWLRLGAKLDEMLKTLGFSVAQTGAGLGAEIMGTAMTLGGMAMTARSVIGSAGNAPMNKARRAEFAEKQSIKAQNEQRLSAMAANNSGVAPSNIRKDSDGNIQSTISGARGVNGHSLSPSLIRDLDDRNPNPPSISGNTGKGYLSELAGNSVAARVDNIQMGPNGTMVGEDADKRIVQGALKGTAAYDDLMTMVNNTPGFAAVEGMNGYTIAGPATSPVLQEASGLSNEAEILRSKGWYVDVKEEGNHIGSLVASRTDSEGNTITQNIFSKSINPGAYNQAVNLGEKDKRVLTGQVNLPSGGRGDIVRINRKLSV